MKEMERKGRERGREKQVEADEGEERERKDKLVKLETGPSHMGTH